MWEYIGNITPDIWEYIGNITPDIWEYIGNMLKIYGNVEHHTIIFGDKYKEHLEDIFDKKKLNIDISYYLHRPTATDRSMAPEGNDCFYVLVPVPNNQSGIDWSIECDKLKKLEIILQKYKSTSC